MERAKRVGTFSWFEDEKTTIGLANAKSSQVVRIFREEACTKVASEGIYHLGGTKSAGTKTKEMAVTIEKPVVKGTKHTKVLVGLPDYAS